QSLRLRRSTVVRLRLERLEDRAMPSVVTWINPASGDWAEPSNWSTGTLPSANDDVVIAVAGEITVTHSVGTDTIRSLVSQERIALTGGSLSIETPSLIQNALDHSGGTLAGAGDLTVAGLLTWTGGTQSGIGRTTATGGLAIAGAADKTLMRRAFN